MKTKNILVLISFFLSMSFFSCKKDDPSIDNPVANKYNPGARSFSEIERAENIPGIKDMPTELGKRINVIYPYQGKLFFGYGDGKNNTGAVDVLSYNVDSTSFSLNYLATTEIIKDYREINGDLYIPNYDPIISVDNNEGSVFRYDNSAKTWQRKTPIKGAGHVFGITYFENKIYVSTSTDLNYSAAGVASSSDMGETWNFEHSIKPNPSDNEDIRYSYVASNSKMLFTSGWIWGKSTRQFAYILKDGIFNSISNISNSKITAPVEMNDQVYLVHFNHGPVKVAGSGFSKYNYIIEADSLKQISTLDENLDLIKWHVSKRGDNDSKEFMFALFLNSSGDYEVQISSDILSWEKIITLNTLEGDDKYTAICFFNNNLYLGTEKGNFYQVKEVFKQM